MNALTRTIQQIAGQLKALSPTAKLLIGSLMIILVMSLFLVSLYAGRPSLSPLGLSGAMSLEARAQAIGYLDSRGIKYQDTGSDILVPVEQKFAIMGQLTENRLVGPDQIDFNTLMSDDSPFRTSQQNKQRYLVAKMNVLAAMISQMSGISRATVVLDQPDGGHGIGRAHVPASASVTVLTTGGELSQTQVDAIASLVAGSHAGLKSQHVQVIDARTNRAMTARTGESMNAGKYMEIKLEAERHAKTTIESALNYISGVLIAVNAQVDATEVVQRSATFDDPKIGVTDVTSRTVTSSNVFPGSEPGVRPNTGLSIGGDNRSGSQSSEELSRESSVPAFGEVKSETKDFKGYALKINASIGVPKSYFVRLHQDREGDATKQPDAATLDKLIADEIDRIKRQVTPLIDTEGLQGAVEGVVAVSMVPDFGAAASNGMNGGNGAAAASLASGSASLVNDGMVKYVGLGALVVVSLTMMFMMVRKANLREQLPTASELVGIPPALAAAESDLVGEADEASPALEGLELTDDAIRRQQMLEQISDMVVSTPEEAAGLLRRWMKSES